MSDSDFKVSESESEKEQEKDESNSDKIASSSKKYKSKVWGFFDKVPGKDGFAECRLCRVQLSYRTSVSNLSKHAMRKHGNAWRQSDSVGYSKNIPEMVHFTRVSDLHSMATCRLCDRSVLCERLNLRKHLANKHPEVPLDDRPAENDNRKLIISEDGQIYEIETSEEQPDVQNIDSLEMDAVYLDEYSDLIKQETVKSPRKRKSTNLARIRPSKNIRSISPQEQILVQNTSPISSGLDLFCSYLSSLLKELPDRECKRLQAEFVHAAVQAQLKCAQVSVKSPPTDNDTSITTNGTV